MITKSKLSVVYGIISLVCFFALGWALGLFALWNHPAYQNSIWLFYFLEGVVVYYIGKSISYAYTEKEVYGVSRGLRGYTNAKAIFSAVTIGHIFFGTMFAATLHLWIQSIPIYISAIWTLLAAFTYRRSSH